MANPRGASRRRSFVRAGCRCGRLSTSPGRPSSGRSSPPFLALQCCTASPVVLAWTQLLAAIVAGLGAYLFCRRVLAVSFWPAAIAAWCYPLTGFFVFWQGYPTGLPVYWLPWILLAVDKTVRGKSPVAPIGLSVVTCLVLVSGHLDIAGQVLLASGLYRAVVSAMTLTPDSGFSARRGRPRWGWRWAGVWVFCWPRRTSCPFWNTRTPARAWRGAARAKRSGRRSGWQALPQTVLPYMYGTHADRQPPPRRRAIEMESSAAAYAGVLATLLVAPLAWCSRRHRDLNLVLGHARLPVAELVSQCPRLRRSLAPARA